jgi:hypothetical protein
MTSLRRLGAAWIALALAAPPMAGQASERAQPWYAAVAHWGRWIGLAGAGTLIGLAAANHEAAQSDFAELETLCREEPQRCQIVQGTDGLPRYADESAERLYQAYADGERAARGYLLGGQLSLIATGGMFIIDFLYRDSRPKNIPYTPFEVYIGRDRLGLAVRF